MIICFEVMHCPQEWMSAHIQHAYKNTHLIHIHTYTLVHTHTHTHLQTDHKLQLLTVAANSGKAAQRNLDKFFKATDEDAVLKLDTAKKSKVPPLWILRIFQR